MPPTAQNSFFAKSRTLSEIKAELTSRHLEAWHAMHSPGLQQEQEEALLYIDLLARPEDIRQEELSIAPLAVLEILASSRGKKFDLTNSLKTFFYCASLPNGGDANLSTGLLSGKEMFLHKPVLLNDVEQQQLTEQLAAGQPAFVLLNPLQEGFPNQLLLHHLLPGNTDMCLYFDVATLKQAIAKTKAGKPLQELLGTELLTEVKDYYKREKDSRKREEFFLSAFEHAFQEKGFLTLTFRIGLPESGLPAYYLVFTTRNKTWYSKVKELLLPYSDYQADGVPALGANQRHQQQLLLFPELNRFSILQLMQDLAAKALVYNYKSIGKIADDHSIGTAYIPENYQVAFEMLRDQGKVQIINHRTMHPVKKSTPGSLIKFCPSST